tara:strand:+ start:14457 stop:16181 length:1725 start_codon:yes stop_codon:yes gene_type:complete
MKTFILGLSILFSQHNVLAQYDGNSTPTYEELISIYEKLALENNEIELYQMGQSDYGLPIYVCIINGGQDSIASFKKARKSTTLLINNAIHPGEPDGVNACLIWMNNWIKKGKKTEKLPVIAIIPAYNVGGMMNRGTSSRANQEGPDEYGFRGNTKNLDLNRDFIKMDSKNMFTFAKIYHSLDPDVFIDTHVSNGADYQYTISHIASVRERMAPELGRLMHEELIPHLENCTKKNDFDLIPYVNLKGETPEEGIVVFNDLPRYAMGYASLMNAMSFTIETHMLKPFPQRVQATLSFLEGAISWISWHKEEIESARLKALSWVDAMEYYPFNFKAGVKKDSILFKGYEFSNPISEVTGLKRLKYHRDKPYEKHIPLYKEYVAMDSTFIPDYYIVEAQCTDVIEKLKANNIIMSPINEKGTVLLGRYKILTYESPKKPYEGHFIHSNIEKEISLIYKEFKPGDVVISTLQKNKRFIISVLEPDTPDSYFAWNTFDSYVQQKEYFSSYVFEDKAEEILEENETLRTEFENKKVSDSEFAKSSHAQLRFIYERSKYYESTHNYLPIYSGMNQNGETEE